MMRYLQALNFANLVLMIGVGQAKIDSAILLHGFEPLMVLWIKAVVSRRHILQRLKECVTSTMKNNHFKNMI